MKNVKSILPHIFPKIDKIHQHRCFNKIVSLLPKNLKEHTLFCYKRDRTLFIVFDHPGIKMEFNYNQKVINEILNMAKKMVNECKNVEISNIKAIVSNKNFKKIKNSNSSFNTYKETSLANFKNYAKNSEIKDLIEKIREKIIKLREDGKSNQ